MIFNHDTHSYISTMIKKQFSDRNKSLYKIYDISVRKGGPYAYYQRNTFVGERQPPFLLIIRDTKK